MGQSTGPAADDDASLSVLKERLAQSPGDAAAHLALGRGLLALDRRAEALEHLFEAQRLAPADLPAREALLSALRGAELAGAGPRVRRALLELFGREDLEHRALVSATWSLLRNHPGAKPWLSPLAAPAALPRAGPEREFLSDPLLTALLVRALVGGVQAETLVARLRRHLLAAALADPTAAAPWTGLTAALACQAEATEYLLPLSEEDRARADRLEALLAEGAEPPFAQLPRLLALATCRAPAPETVLRLCPTAPQGRPEVALALAAVRLRFGDLPLATRRLAREIPALTPIAPGISTAVRMQYEENPYPRWLAAPRPEPRPMAEVLATALPDHPEAWTDIPAPRALVAGCGTGRHPLQVARRYAGVEVLAVDLSRAALAYAAAMAERAGLANIAFAQADILEIDRLEDRFDLIACSGVLHHLAEPERGLAKLVARLAPGGLMRLALYSRAARRGVAAARALVAAEGLEPTPDGIRRARAALRALPRDHPARAVTLGIDFRSLSGCRDLVFHVQEDPFDLPRLGRALAAEGLDFLGFVLAPDTRAAYRAWNPADPRMIDLDAWRRFEDARPDTFAAMYQFWCRRRSAGDPAP